MKKFRDPRIKNSAPLGALGFSWSLQLLYLIVYFSEDMKIVLDSRVMFALFPLLGCQMSVSL